ncbi:GLPGLI family protein [Myroides sp. LJL110]
MILFSACSTWGLIAQQNDSIMRYSFIANFPVSKDSSGIQQVQEIVYLDIFKNKSRFASEVEVFRTQIFNQVNLCFESAQSELDKAQALANSRTTRIPYSVYKNDKILTTYQQLVFSDYKIKEDWDLIVWDIDPRVIILNQMQVQQARGRVGKRDWIVWFTKDIALQEGPYKFKNLPGFVIKAQTKDGLFSFELLKSEKVFNDYWLPINDRYALEVDRAKWTKIKRITSKKTYGQLIDESGLTNIIVGKDGQPLSTQERNQKLPSDDIPIELD